MNLGTHFIPQWDNWQPGGNGLFPKVGTCIARKNIRTGLKEETWRLEGLKHKWTNTAQNMSHCREDIKDSV